MITIIIIIAEGAICGHTRPEQGKRTYTSGATGRDGAAQQTKGEQNLFWKMNPKSSKEQHGEGDE